MPRTTYGADFIKISKSAHGYTDVLGIIDLTTSNLVLRAVKHRTSKATARVIYYDVILKKGVPLLFHSDGAKEFINGASKILSTMLGYKLTTTKAHNPEANGKMERAWTFVGACLQTMTKEQYECLHLYMDVMSHVWNTQPASDTNITPFELEHGKKARSVADTLMDLVPQQVKSMDARDLKVIIQSTKAFQFKLRCVKAVEKVRTAEALNSKGLPKKLWKVGDKVSFFIPPSQNQMKQTGKRKKHIFHYRSPANC